MDFPQSISLTITNLCNLKCRMCGQWSCNGYIRKQKEKLKNEMTLDQWKKVIDELALHNITSLILRGGEVFLFPGIIELLEYIHDRGMFISIDTNGTVLEKFAGEIARIGKMHLTFSVDGPEEIHDYVRGVKGCFEKTKKGIQALHSAVKEKNSNISTSATFTISAFSYKGLGNMPDVCRSLGIPVICVVPYYYFPEETGRQYEKELKENFDCDAFSWYGFQQNDSGIDFDEFIIQYRQFLAGLKGIINYPYVVLSESQFKTWFADTTTPVGPQYCTNVERLIDIQPDGSVNFCVDLIDYSFGNVKNSSIKELWNNDRARLFREYRRGKCLAVCHRCGAKFMSSARDKDGFIIDPGHNKQDDLNPVI